MDNCERVEVKIICFVLSDVYISYSSYMVSSNAKC